jgi:hypothetical protein
MATSAEVLSMLLPNQGWYILGDDFETITYDKGVEPITKKQFDDGFKKFDELKTKENFEKTTAKSALLERLGITADEAALLLS